MSNRWILMAIGALTLAACEGPAKAPAPNLRPPTPAEQECANQGHWRGTEEYDQCVARASGVPQPLPPPAVTPPAGVEATRDEYGFRYDGQGHRLDRSGNIISPQSTQP